MVQANRRTDRPTKEAWPQVVAVKQGLWWADCRPGRWQEAPDVVTSWMEGCEGREKGVWHGDRVTWRGHSRT